MCLLHFTFPLISNTKSELGCKSHDLLLSHVLLLIYLTSDLTITHYINSIRHTEKLWHFRRNHYDGLTLLCKIFHNLIYLVLRSYINTSGRFIHDKDVRIICQPSGNYYLLLITTGKIFDVLIHAWCFDRKLFDAIINDLIYRRMIEYKSTLQALVVDGDTYIILD